MREFLDGILMFISAGTLSNEEWATIGSLDTQGIILENYTFLLGVIDARESVSGARDRLGFYFKAAGVSIPQTATGKSNIFMGAPLC